MTFNQGVTGSKPVGPTPLPSFSDRFLVVGNWKMYGDRRCVTTFCQKASLPPEGILPIVCPPSLYCYATAEALPKGYALGAQECSQHLEGAYTGQISATMLRDVGCRFVLIGHSESRSTETPHSLSDKIFQAEMAGLIPILCVGETQADSWQDQLFQQLISLKDIRTFPEQLLCAYEPAWCIGTSVIPSAVHLKSVFSFLDEYLQRPYLYGGSVTAQTLPFLHHSIPKLSGVLVGRASRDPEVFNELISLSASLKRI